MSFTLASPPMAYYLLIMAMCRGLPGSMVASFWMKIPSPGKVASLRRGVRQQLDDFRDVSAFSGLSKTDASSLSSSAGLWRIADDGMQVSRSLVGSSATAAQHADHAPEVRLVLARLHQGVERKSTGGQVVVHPPEAAFQSAASERRPVFRYALSRSRRPSGLE